MTNFKTLDFNFDNAFKNKKIIVTGSSRGLGLKTCEALASRGASLAMFSRSIKEMKILKKKLTNPSNHICIKVDLLKNSNIKNDSYSN